MSDGQLPDGFDPTDIAVVGMAGRFPGASSVDEFWRNVRGGVDAGTRLSDDELRDAGVSDEELANPGYVPVSYSVDDMAGFDAGFFGFSPREASIMDPQQRHFLEIAWAAMEDAGRDPASEQGSVGVFAGCGASLYLMRNLLTHRELERDVGFFLLRHTGNDKDFLATRVSYLLDLTGPSINVQTACSTSLVAIHLACQSLLMNECDVALAGGSTFRQPHQVGYVYEEGEIMSPDGACRTFDERAEGTVFGSGVGAVVLRRLEDALADGDVIHAVVKGTAINNDGSAKVGYLAPSVDAQALNLAEALAVSGVNPADLAFIECHGTATPVGDPIEVAALNQAFAGSGAAPGSIALGSVKTNVGHLDTAAGVTGFIKTVLALREGEIPPSLHFEAPNPAIDFEGGPFYVGAELQDWPQRAAHRFAAVSALGAGGTNAHAVLQSPPARTDGDAPSRDWQLFPISAKSPAALDARGAQLIDHLRSSNDALADVAHTLQVGRQDFAHRRVAVARTGEEAAALIEAGDPKVTPTAQASSTARSIVYMFAGGGAQYPGMGRHLYEREPVYRAAVDECIQLLQPQLDWSLSALLYAAPSDLEKAAEEMRRPSRSLPCLFITQYAMARLLMSWGLDPDGMIGHSMGEYTAAHLAGVFSLADALSLVTTRGRLFETVPAGGMLSVPLDAAELRERMPEGLSIAADNAPGLSVASGPVDLLDELEKALLEDDIDSTRIHIDIAAHSSMLDSILDEFRSFCEQVRYNRPERRFISNLAGGWADPDEVTTPDYWVRHLRETVRFADGVGELLSTPGRVMVEVGPGRILATLASLHGSKDESHEFVTTMRHPAEDADDVETALRTLGRIWTTGVEVDWSRLHGDDLRRRVTLPAYPFQHETYFIEPGVLAPPEPTLDRRMDVGAWFWRPTWHPTPPLRMPDGAEDERWLVFHDGEGLVSELAGRLGGEVVSVLPGSSYEEHGSDSFRVRPGSAEDVEAVLSALGDAGPSRIVYGWCLKDGADEDRTFYGLLALGQAIGSAGLDQDVRLDVLTAAGQHVGGETRLNPVQALPLGPVRVFPKEFPELTSRAIDLQTAEPQGPARTRALEQIMLELALPGDDEVVAWRGSQRFTQTFEEVPLEADEEDVLSLGDGAVWLITGGLGGLGLLVAEELARRSRVRLVLTSRRSERPPVVQSLEALGAEVLIVQADVTDEEQMRAAVDRARSTFGRINGVVHAAGVVEDALVMMKDTDSAARVLAPKVTGTRVLTKVLDGEGVERVLYFSSRGAYAGVAGQVDYASASAFLNAHAIAQSEIEGTSVVSIDWSAWKDVGIAAGGAATGRPVDHAFIDRCVVEAADQRVYETRFSDRAHWLLDEHRLRSGEALIPGTGYLELIGSAVEETGRRSVLELQDIFFFSPFMVEAGGSRTMRITIDGEGDDLDVVVEGQGAGGDWEEHCRGSAAATERAAPPFDLAAVQARCSDRVVTFDAEQQRNANLTLGHRWGNLERLGFGAWEALAELALPDDVASEAGSFRMHPALLDVACACAQELVPDFDTASQFFIPVSYGRVTVFEDLPSRCVSHIRLSRDTTADSDSAVYQITIATTDGRVIADIDDFTMMRVRDGARVSQADRSTADAAPSGPLQFEGAIEPDEGLEALRRIVVSGALGEIVVSPQHLPTYLAALKEPPEALGVDQAPAIVLDLVDASEVEEKLKEHEAIEDAVVLAHAADDGEINAAAFIVWELGEELTIAEVTRFLDGEVPAELMPKQLVEMDEFPRGPDGDVDRHALPDPYAPIDDYVAPSTEMERAIAGIWMELLGVGRVSVHDNFLDVGGHSLLAMRAISKISKQVGVRLNPSVMTLNTLGQIAAECEGSTVGAGS